MKKIVELLIDWDNIEFDDLGVEVMSLVDKPAIGVDFLAFSAESYVDNSDYMHFKEFLDANQDLMKKPFTGANTGGVDHKEQLKKLEAAGVNIGYPFGYCFQIAQFLFYALGGYDSKWDLKCIKQMHFEIEGVEFEATHWYVEHQETSQIIDLSAEQFDGLLDIQEWYPRGVRANLGFPYYNVEEKRVEFEETVPSLQTLKLYNKWKEEHGELAGIEKYYQASRYEEVRMSNQEFVEPKADESKSEFISRCIPVVRGEGYPEDQAAAICYTYWEGDAESGMKEYFKLAQELGETLSFEDTFYVDATKEAFTNIGEWMKGIGALDILGKILNKKDSGVVKYRYAGPTPERPFCRAMMNLNKVYTLEELRQMGRNVGNGIDRGSNAIMRWKGGPNCRHFFEQVRLYKDGYRTVVVSEGPADIDEMSITMESRPNGGYRMMQFSNDEEMIVTGPAMVPQQLILRKDEKGNPFHVYFSKDTIKKIAQKFFEYNKMNNTDIDHDDKVTTENTLLESWIVDDPEMDKAKSMGFEVPKGTWFVSYKINNQETWQKIKEGKINGFSIMGNFIEVAKKL